MVARPVTLPWETPRGRRPRRDERDEATAELLPGRNSGHNPEFFQDKGCSIHPACLTCPLPVCRYEVPDAKYPSITAPREALLAEVARLQREGRTTEEIAAATGHSRRTITYDMKLLRERATA